MSAPPYMKLYIADYLADTTHLTTAQHGAYLLLLMAMWRAGGKLPNKDAKLAAITKTSAKEWNGLKPILMEMFRIRGGAIRHKRLTKELAKYTNKIGTASEPQNRIHSENDNKNKPHRPSKNRHNQNHNQKVSGEPIKGSSTNRQARGARDLDGRASPPSVVVDLEKLREQIAAEQAEIDARNTSPKENAG